MKRELKLVVALAAVALVCGCASDRGGTQRGEVSPYPGSSISDTKTSNCVGIGCCTSQASCDEKGQLSKPAAPEFRFDLEVHGRAMPEEFGVSENLLGEKVTPEPVKISDYASEGIKKGVAGGALAGGGLGIALAKMFPPLIIFTPVLVAAGVVVGGVGGAVVGTGVGGAKHGISVSRAHRSEREAAYSQLTELLVAGVKKEFESQELLSLAQDAPGVESRQVNVTEYTVWIKPLGIRVKEKPTNVSDKQADSVNQVDVVTDVEARSKTDQRIVWQTQFHATFRISGDLRTAAAEAMNRAGKEIAALTFGGLNAAQSRGTLTATTVSSSSGTILTGTGRPLLHRGAGQI